jgi:molybdopterin/thiamine biosynthesis adenylyltransferase
MQSEVLSGLEIRRYSQQIELPSVGISGQEKIKQSKVLVVGAGGKGSALMQHLVAAGVGKIGISDNYLVEEKVLPNQILYGNSDLGKQKAIISKQKLSEINHLTKIELHNVCLAESNIFQICNGYDIVVDATDNLPAHYLINDAAIRLNKPLVYGFVYNSQAHVSVFNYNDGPSFRCMYSQIPIEKDKVWLNGIVNVGIISGIAGTIMANEVLKVILDMPFTLSGILMVFDVSEYVMKMLKIRKDPVNFKL